MGGTARVPNAPPAEQLAALPEEAAAAECKLTLRSLIMANDVSKIDEALNNLLPGSSDVVIAKPVSDHALLKLLKLGAQQTIAAERRAVSRAVSEAITRTRAEAAAEAAASNQNLQKKLDAALQAKDVAERRTQGVRFEMKNAVVRKEKEVAWLIDELSKHRRAASRNMAQPPPRSAAQPRARANVPPPQPLRGFCMGCNLPSTDPFCAECVAALM